MVLCLTLISVCRIMGCYSSIKKAGLCIPGDTKWEKMKSLLIGIGTIAGYLGGYYTPDDEVICNNISDQKCICEPASVIDGQWSCLLYTSDAADE